MVNRAGAALPRLVRIDKEPGEPFGVEVSSAVFDRIRTCDNHCAFCFIYQLPKGMRKSLYLKDDDYRLSFLYGNFTTLTRFTELDAERILTERLGPLFVSIHSTDPELRAPHAAQPQGGDEPALAERPARRGHRGARPGRRLPRGQRRRPWRTPWPACSTSTLRWPRSAWCPSGISQFPTRPRCAPHGRGGGQHPRHRDRVAAHLQKTLGRRLVYAADEYYLLAGRPFPTGRAYDGFPQHENGIGMARAFSTSFTRAGKPAPAGCATASSPRSTAPRPRATGPPGCPPADRAGPDRGMRRRPAGTVLTGTYGARMLRAAAGPPPPRRRTVHAVANDFFGGNIGVAGLLTGEDLARTLADRADGTPVPAARRLPQRGSLPRRPHPGRPSPARRSGPV